ncbi:hypothetical protein ACFFX0_16825 [Citricoccus parietis]|uniref:Uncharacterized protein n=1 Tax=Citricoccus parietis TaxID=592307 RepID=A0ABV5G1F5_9MICC
MGGEGGSQFFVHASHFTVCHTLIQQRRTFSSLHVMTNRSRGLPQGDGMVVGVVPGSAGVTS